jgi:hypothetical protein
VITGNEMFQALVFTKAVAKSELGALAKLAREL